MESEELLSQGKELGRMQAKIEQLEKDQASLSQRLWAVVLLVIAYVANRVMGLVGGGS